MASSINDFEAGQTVFNQLVRFNTDLFKTLARQANSTFIAAREKSDSTIKDIADPMIGAFVKAAEKSTANQEHLHVFVLKKAESILGGDPERTIASAFIQLLGKAGHGEISFTPAEQARHALLVETGKARFLAFKNSPTGAEKSAAANALKLLNPELNLKAFDQEHKWDVKTHTLIPCAFDRTLLNEFGIARRDFRIHAVTTFVEQVFPAEDREAVKAFLYHELFQDIDGACAIAPELYIHFTSGWDSQLHTKVDEKAQAILQQFV